MRGKCTSKNLGNSFVFNSSVKGKGRAAGMWEGEDLRERWEVGQAGGPWGGQRCFRLNFLTPHGIGQHAPFLPFLSPPLSILHLNCSQVQKHTPKLCQAPDSQFSTLLFHVCCESHSWVCPHTGEAEPHKKHLFTHQINPSLRLSAEAAWYQYTWAGW